MFSFRFGVCLHLRQKPQDERVRRMATLKAISMRLKSVKNIQKITKSMKMVSAAKFTKAEKELKQARPLGEGLKLFYAKAEVGKEREKTPEEKKQSHEEEIKTVYLAVTSDRGLCGAAHTSVTKLLRKTSIQPSEHVKIVCIGEKARNLLHKHFGEHFLFVCQEIGRIPPTFLDASLIANEVLKSGFEYDSVKIFYNHFRSVVSYSTQCLEVFNMGKILKSPKIHVYDETDEETLLPVAEFSLAVSIFFALKEGSCSEQSSRMTAMDSASKNAGDMISKLTLTYNRTRQAVITRELIEIISGASAL